MFTKRVHGHYRVIRKGAGELNALCRPAGRHPETMGSIAALRAGAIWPDERSLPGRHLRPCTSGLLSPAYADRSLGGAMAALVRHRRGPAAPSFHGELVMFISVPCAILCADQIRPPSITCCSMPWPASDGCSKARSLPEVRIRPDAHVQSLDYEERSTSFRVGFHYRAERRY